MNAILERPIITEKSLTLASKGWYSFAVPKQTRKEDIADAVHKQYNVTVTSVRTISFHGKERRVGRLMRRIRKPDWKKAVVHLAEGQHIPVFEVTKQEEPKPEKK